VADRLRTLHRGLAVGSAVVPIVPAAILFDLANGGDKDWTENPYRALGQAAFDAAAADFSLGTAGAGTGATTADLKGGLGSASLVLESGEQVGALVAVNAFGSVTVPGTRSFWAAPFEIDGEFGSVAPAAVHVPPATPRPAKPGPSVQGNTTIAIVATNATLTKAAAQRMAEAAHDGMARAIFPAHTLYDGDLIFGIATGAHAPEVPQSETLLALGHAAGLCLARAIARAVHAARPSAGDTLPCWSESG
jgi:D-aminopeptidase